MEIFVGVSAFVPQPKSAFVPQPKFINFVWFLILTSALNTYLLPPLDEFTAIAGSYQLPDWLPWTRTILEQEANLIKTKL